MRQSSIIRTGALGLMVFWLLGQGLRAAGAPDDKPAAPQERLEALKRESEQIYGRMEARRARAKGDAEKEAAVDAYFKAMRGLAGAPFVLLGINGDDDREAAKAAMTRERMTWRSWWNGGKTGGIVTRMGVTSWPTVYILDAKGVIRYENVRYEAMDQAIDRLVQEAKAGDQ